MTAPGGRQTGTSPDTSWDLPRWRRIVAWVFVADLVGLAGSGVYLFFLYRPTAAQAWDDIYRVQGNVQVGLLVRALHRWLARAAVLIAALLLGLTIAQATPTHGRRSGPWAVGAAAVMIPVLLFAMFTGWLLPWDQLALWAVTVGTNMAGYRPIFSNQVRWILVGGSQVDPGEFRRWIWVHAVAVPLAVVGLTIVAFRRRSGMQADPVTPDAAPPSPLDADPNPG